MELRSFDLKDIYIKHGLDYYNNKIPPIPYKSENTFHDIINHLTFIIIENVIKINQVTMVS